MFTAGFFEGAEDQRAAAALFHVIGQILPGDVRCAALIGALHREARAVKLMVLGEEEKQAALT